MARKTGPKNVRPIKFGIKSKKVTAKLVTVTADGKGVGQLLKITAPGAKGAKPLFLTAKPGKNFTELKKSTRLHRNETAAVKRVSGPFTIIRPKVAKKV